MRCVIQVTENPPTFLLKSTPEQGRPWRGGVGEPNGPKVVSDIEMAEVWTDPEAAKAWCYQHDCPDAQILQLDAPKIIRPTELRVLDVAPRAMTNAELTALRKPEAEEAETPAPKKKPGRKGAKKSAKAQKLAPDPQEQAAVARELDKLERMSRQM